MSCSSGPCVVRRRAAAGRAVLFDGGLPGTAWVAWESEGFVRWEGGGARARATWIEPGRLAGISQLTPDWYVTAGSTLLG